MHPWMITFGLCGVALLSGCQSATRPAATKPLVADDHLDLITTYGIYAKSIWHNADVGGYWGGGIAEKNGNGAVRGMSNITMGYATLAFALDNDWLSRDQRGRLQAAGLNRERLLHYSIENLRHLCAHHVSANQPRQPTWGLSWQSSMWCGAFVPAALLMWDDIPFDLREQIKRVVFVEADRIAAKPPKDYKPGDTGAEENAWDAHAPALALALDPDHPRAQRWLKALRTYAVNVYSVRADRTSDARIGSDRIGAIVSTANCFDDFSMENHGFFHPDYIQVSGQHLGEAWLYLQLGDRIHGTHLARDFRPYALHHASDVWKNVEKLLVLPDGELTFPNGTDWTVNASITPSYYAFIATALSDSVALQALKQLPKQAWRHREKSPEGGILADTNLEWWWEPLLVQRTCTALLQLALRPSPALPSEEHRGEGDKQNDLDPLRFTATQLLPDSKIFIHRNPSYFASAAWGNRKMGTFTPFDDQYFEHPYMTLPLDTGILPDSVDHVLEQRAHNDIQILVLESTRGTRSAMICFSKCVLWLSSEPLRPLGIENDPLSGGRMLYFNNEKRAVAPLKKIDPFPLPGSSVNINNRLGLISTRDGFHYRPAGGFNRKSAAIDALVPLATWGVWLMVPGATAEQTGRMSDAFGAQFDGNLATVTVQDGPAGHRYRVKALLAPTPSQKRQPSVLIDALD